MYRLDELQKVLSLSEIKDFNDFKNYYKDQKKGFDKTLLENILIKKVNNTEVLDFNDFKTKDGDAYYCDLLCFLNTVLNLKEIDCFESFKEFFNCDCLELQKRIFESFFRNCLENINFDFNSDGNLIIKKTKREKEVIRPDFKEIIDTIIHINVSVDKGLKILGVNDEFYNGCNEDYINHKLINEFKDCFYYKLTDVYNMKELEERDLKVINFFTKYIEEKFFSTEKEIKKYILKHRI